MPTYEYRCTQGHHFELFQRISDDPVDSCPECGASAERLLSSGAGFIFKGSGFYITDYRSDTYKKAAQAETGTSGAKSEPAKTESAPAKSESASTGSPAPKSSSSD